MATKLEIAPKPATATADVAQITEPKMTPDSARLEQLQQTDARVGIQTYGRLPLSFARGQGVHLWDHAGKQYLDFLGGIAVVTLGHAHPTVTAAISKQAATLLHSSNLFYIEPQVELAEKLYDLSDGMRAFFCNSGAEANEAALKLARRFFQSQGDDRQEIITTHDSFHGRTYAALAATGQPKYHENFQPIPGGFSYVPLNDIDALRAAANERTAAIMLEPIQGESGVRPATREYLQAARQIADEVGALLIFDEVQCGIGRTGTFFAFEDANVKPDIVTLAKGLGNGVPIGAMLANERAAGAFVPGTHGSTFGGNFLSSAAALATLQVLAEENLLQNAREIGDYFAEKLRAWGEANDAIEEVRGRGLMIGAVLKHPVARKVLESGLERGLIFNAVGDKVLRFLPPLCATREDVDAAMEILDAAWQSVDKS